MLPQPFPRTYRNLLGSLLFDFDGAITEVNRRTNCRIKALPGGTSFKLDLTDGRVPVVGGRKLYPHIAAAELAWFLSGSDRLDLLRDLGAAHLWEDFADEDGRVVSYGHRWRKHYEVDQLATAIDRLRVDSSDRRCYVTAWDPDADLPRKGQRTVPCPVGFTLSVQAGRLHSSVLLRSSDVFVGLPYDVMGHAMLVSLVAKYLGVQPGTAHFTLAHAHLYEPHWEAAEAAWVAAGEALQLGRWLTGPRVPGFTVLGVEKYPDVFVHEVREASLACDWPDPTARPALVL